MTRQTTKRRLLNRREALTTIAALAGLGATAAPAWQLALFSAEVTPPLGHALMGGGIAPARTVDDPLFCHGFVLLGLDRPVVVAAVDWCELRNDAYDQWRKRLALAAQTSPERVLVCCLHQHDAPIADLTAQRLLEEQQANASVCDRAFHEQTVERVGKVVRSSLEKARPITHLGIGQARVEQVASNRRTLNAEGKPVHDRTSATRNPELRARPEGTIDPWLKTLSFWDKDEPVAALSVYATHPMSYYGQGRVSSDFVGLARKRRQAALPGVLQLYASGCSGNVTAGKYNDGAPEQRPLLADRLVRAMTAAWEATRRVPLQEAAFRSVPLVLEPRNEAEFTVAALKQRLANDPKPFGRCLAALGLSWRQRVEAGQPIDVPVLDFGAAVLLLLPGESYVEFQLAAQQLRPESFVVTLGYGESGTGYVPIERAIAEHDTNLRDWCWVAPGSEARMLAVLKTALRKA